MARRYGTEGCSVEGCDRSHLARGFCGLHYKRDQAGLPLEGPARDHEAPPADGICSADGCDRPFYGRGWCRLHYYRWKRNGTIDLLPVLSDEDRFWSKVDKSGSCWLWTGTFSRGYGYFKINGRMVRAPRFAYQLLVGPIPGDLTVDHLCFVSACVNPAHMELVTAAENSRRMRERVTR